MTARKLPTAAERAEAEWLRSSKAVHAAERAKLETETASLLLTIEEQKHDLKMRSSLARERRVFDFVGEVTEFEVKSAVDELNDWATESKDLITIRLCSPGGSVFDGFFLFDFVQDLRRAGCPVYVYAMGYAASMASVLLQAGERRLIARNTWFMVHEPSTIALGKASDIKDEALLMGKLHKQLVGILAERSTLTQKQIIARCQRKDWWMPAAEAVRHGFADELV